MISPDRLDELRQVLVLLPQDPDAARAVLLRIIAEAERELAWRTLRRRPERPATTPALDGAP